MADQLPGVGEQPTELVRAACVRQRRVVTGLERYFLAHDQAEEIRFRQDLDMDEGAVRLDRDTCENLAAVKPEGTGDIVITHPEDHSDERPSEMAFPAQPARH